MRGQQNTLEPSPKLELDKKRFRVNFCPCGKSNKDGKFMPYVGFENKGYCHSCDETFLPELPPIENIYFYVSFDEIKDYNEKSYRIKIANKICYLPKSQVLNVCDNGCYVSEYILKQDKNPLPYDKNNFKSNTEYIAPKVFRGREIAPAIIKKPVSFIPVELFKASLNPTAFETNNFVKFLINLFGVEVAGQLVSRYFIGTSKHQFTNKDFPNYKSERGATIFWQIDTGGKIRTGKIMLYSPTTGKRVKEPYNHIDWVHKRLKQPDFTLGQCLFGEHLINQNLSKPIAIVESEKTAIIASVYLTQFIWLAFGGIGFKIEKCNVLRGRNVILFPDCSLPKNDKPTAFESWTSKAKELSHIANFQVSDLLERKASEAERQQGFDLADYLIQYDHKAFAIPAPETKATEPPPAVQPLVEVKPIEQPEPVCHIVNPGPQKPETWERDIAELENYFTGITLPTQPVKLNRCSTIANSSLFIETHFATLKANNGNKTFLPFLTRLQQLKQVFTKP